jgi:predicted phage-related endonuclease
MPIVSLTPHDRDEWLAFRRQDVTASQIAAVIGQHPYCSALELWAQKSGQIVTVADNAAMRRGRLLEPVAVKLTQEALPGCRIQYNDAQLYWRDEERRIGATPDVIVEYHERGKGVVQLKNIEPSIYARHWQADEPPLWIALQALTEAKLVGAQWAAVGALRVGFGIEFDLMPVPLHEGAWSRLTDAVGDFWRAVEAGNPPQPDYARDHDLIAAMHPASNGASIDLSGDNELIVALAEREEAKGLASGLDEQIKRLDATIRHKLGAHEIALAGDWRITLRTEHRKEYTVAAGTRRPIKIKRIRGEARE